MDLFRQIPEVEAPRGLQGNMVQQYGSFGLTPEDRKLLKQASMAGEGVLRSNVSDFIGTKDAFLAGQNKSPVNALWAALSALPVAKGGKIAKGTLKGVRGLARGLSGRQGDRGRAGTKATAKVEPEMDALIKAYVVAMMGGYR
jgi:hypothetical protein